MQMSNLGAFLSNWSFLLPFNYISLQKEAGAQKAVRKYKNEKKRKKRLTHSIRYDMTYSGESGSCLTSKTKLGTNCSFLLFLLDGSEPWAQELGKKRSKKNPTQLRQKSTYSNTSIKSGFTTKEKFVQRKSLGSIDFDPQHWKPPHLQLRNEVYSRCTPNSPAQESAA